MFGRTLAAVLYRALIVLVLVTSLPASVASVGAVSDNVVISQVYGGGGNSGATYKNDFVELYNRGSTAADVTGWTVQYASSSGSTWQKTALTGTVEPGKHYLVQEAAGAGGSVSLPTPNAIGTIAMAAGAGKVALVSNGTALAGTCPMASAVDFVGYGAANCSETAPTAALSNTTAALRNGNGATDTDNNSADFTVGAPNPRSSVTSSNPAMSLSASPSVVAPGETALLTAVVKPGENPESTGLTVAANLTAIGGSASQTLFDDGTNGDVSPGDNTFSYLATVSSAATPCKKSLAFAVTDAQGRSASGALSMVVVSSSPTISQIQGPAHLSPLAGQCVAATGVVTGTYNKGFYLQSTTPDADPNTSEGILAYTSSMPTVAVGDSVRVGGRIDEYRSGGSSSPNLTATEFTNLAVDVMSKGNALPDPVVIGIGGRMPPTEIIENDASPSVETSGVFDPAQDGIDFYETLEGMLVQVNDAVAVGPTVTSYGELAVVPDGASWSGVDTPRGGIVIQASDYNPERIILDDTIVPMPVVSTGATFAGPIVGVLDYTFGNYKLEATSSPKVKSDTLTPERVATPSDDLPAGKLSVAAFNVENLAPSNPPSKFAQLAGLIVDNLGAPDLIAVEEVQDNSGATNNGTVAADVTWAMLIDAIESAGGPTYVYRQIDPVDNADGGAPGANIRQGFLFREDRGLSFVDRGSATSTSATSVEMFGGVPQLSLSPGRIDPTNAAFADSRKPLAGEFHYKGETLFVVANHFNSKGGDQPLFGRYQPPTLSSEAQRLQQATVVADFVSALSAADPHASVVVLGDLNDFQFSEPLGILKDAGLTALIETLPVGERYTYVYDGNSEALDQVLISAGLTSRSFGIDVVHVNAEFPATIRASDHDPQVAQLCVDRTAPSISVTLSPDSLWPPDHRLVKVEATVTATDNSGSVKVDLVSVTSNEPDNGLGDGDKSGDIVIVDNDTFRLRAERSGTGGGRVYTVTYRATDACGNTTTTSATVSVPLGLGLTG